MYRKNLSADGMFAVLRKSFGKVSDRRGTRAAIGTADALMTALAAFSFKFGSFRKFYERLEEPDGPLAKAIGGLYKIGSVPSPTRIKEIVDPLDHRELSRGFGDLLREVQRGKALEPYVFLDGHYLVAGDGTQYFRSEKIHCKRCLVKTHRGGKKSYSHQMYAGCIVAPGLRQVLPLAPEPIRNGDGNTKNDCERAASGRFFERLRKDHPKMAFVVTGDGLSSNGPHIRKLRSLGMKFILGAKPGDHKYLYGWVEALGDGVGGVSRTFYNGSRVRRRTVQKIRYANGVPLNDGLAVNFLEVEESVERAREEIKHDASGKATVSTVWEAEKKTKFAWVTDIDITEGNAFRIMEGGRKRWSIENETFNTLKNMGYSWEHNYGHGEDNLSTNFALLMMLAFAVDQIQELCCPLFRRALEKTSNCKKYLWERFRENIGGGGWCVDASFFGLVFGSWKNFFGFIVYGRAAFDTG